MRNRLIRSHRTRPAVRRYAGRRHILPARLRASKPIRAYDMGIDADDLEFIVTYEQWVAEHHSADGFREGEFYTFDGLVNAIRDLSEASNGYCLMDSADRDGVRLEFRTGDTGDDSMAIEYVTLKCRMADYDRLTDILDDAVSGIR